MQTNELFPHPSIIATKQTGRDIMIRSWLIFFKILWVGSLNWEGLPLLQRVVAGITHMAAAT